MNRKVVRSLDRGHTNTGWLDSYHSFSFGDYLNPNQMDFGALKVLNVDRIAHGKGFGSHEHADMEIVTIPIQGVLHHTDSEGNDKQLQWGEFQVMSCGKGMTHTEYNDVDKSVLELLQIWIEPEVSGSTPSYDLYNFTSRIKENQLTELIAPEGDALGRLKQNA